MIIRNNIDGMFAGRMLSGISRRKGRLNEKLASGMRINRAGDDAAGLVISEKMRGQVRGLRQAARNVQDGISLLQTAEGGLAEAAGILQRMREMAVQALNGTLNSNDKEALQLEFDQLKQQIDNIANNTDFNGISLLNRISSGSRNVSAYNVWQLMDSGISTAVKSIVWDGSKYIAAGDFGKILTSMDGNEWTLQSSGTANHLNSIEYLNGRYFAVGSEGTIITSSDAISWQNVNTGIITELRDITWNGSQYIAVGNDRNIFRSTDGVNWASVNSIQETEHLLTVTYGGGRFAALGYGAVLSTSSDGTTWTNSNLPYETITDMVWNGEKFVAVGNVGSILVSADGQGWHKAVSGTGDVLRDISWDGELFRAVTSDGNIIASKNGENWNMIFNNTDSSISLGHALWNGTDTYIGLGWNGEIFRHSIPTEAGTDLLVLQDGPNSGDRLVLSLADIRSGSLGLDNIDLSAADGAFQDRLDGALDKVSGERSRLGAYQNRLESKIRILEINEENLAAAESRIRDQDIAKAVLELAKNDILGQAAQAMLAQANQAPEGVLQLLR